MPNWQHPPGDVLMTFTIYERRSECSGTYYVVVPWAISSSGQEQHEPIGAVPTVMDARRLIPPWADWRQGRSANDAPDVVETWL